MNVALNKFSVKSFNMIICQNLYNMSVKRCAEKGQYKYNAHRFTDMLFTFWQILIYNNFKENLFNATFMFDIIVT